MLSSDPLGGWMSEESVRVSHPHRGLSDVALAHLMGEWGCHALYTEGPLSSHLRLLLCEPSGCHYRPAVTLSAGILPTLQRASCLSVAGVQITLGFPQTD